MMSRVHSVEPTNRRDVFILTLVTGKRGYVSGSELSRRGIDPQNAYGAPFPENALKGADQMGAIGTAIVSGVAALGTAAISAFGGGGGGGGASEEDLQNARQSGVRATTERYEQRLAQQQQQYRQQMQQQQMQYQRQMQQQRQQFNQNMMLVGGAGIVVVGGLIWATS